MPRHIEKFEEYGTPTLVYVRPMSGAELLSEGRRLKLPVEGDQTLYAVFGADGKRIAVLTDSAAAFSAAIAHNLTPVSVH